MENLKNYYNISIFGENASVAEFQKKYSFKLENGYDSYVYLRANDALEYAVRLGRKDKDIVQTLDKIIWNLTECVKKNKNKKNIPLLKNELLDVILYDLYKGRNVFEFFEQGNVISDILIGDFKNALFNAKYLKSRITKTSELPLHK